jgi:hypothetical protein
MAIIATTPAKAAQRIVRAVKPQSVTEEEKDERAEIAILRRYARRYPHIVLELAMELNSP